MKIARREFGFGVRLAVPEGRDIYRSMPANRNSRAHLWATEGDSSLRWSFGFLGWLVAISISPLRGWDNALMR